MNKIELEYSQETLDNMLKVHSVFNRERIKLNRIAKQNKCSVFAPKLPENIKRIDLKTIIDLSVNAPIRTLILKSSKEVEGLENRAAAYTSGNLNIQFINGSD